jgi:uncharacterized membrane protein YsdA (DUF1294 family)
MERRAPQRGDFRLGHAAVLLALLVLPTVAVAKLPVDWRLAALYAVCLSLVAYIANQSDKARAQANEWRISEATLHLLELIGGWPGAFVAQRRFRHKIAKPSYQAVFWAVVLLYQFVAYDSLQRWKFSGALVSAAINRGR